MSTYFEDAFTEDGFKEAVTRFLTRSVDSIPETDTASLLEAKALVEGITLALDSVNVGEMKSLGPVRDLIRFREENGNKGKRG